MEKKFNKANVSDLIIDEITRIENKYRFNPDNGTAQLQYCKKGEEQENAIAYGRYVALRDLHLELFGNDKNFYGI